MENVVHLCSQILRLSWPNHAKSISRKAPVDQGQIQHAMVESNCGRRGVGVDRETIPRPACWFDNDCCCDFREKKELSHQMC